MLPVAASYGRGSGESAFCKGIRISFAADEAQRPRGRLAFMSEFVRQPFAWPVRVYYEDTDAGGVVYHATYLKFMERARTEWLRAKGFVQSELLREHEVIFVVRAVQVEYLKPAVFDDLLGVTVRLAGAGRSQMEIAQTVEHAGRGDALAKGMIKVVCVNGRSFKPVAIPAAIRQQLERES